MILEIRTYRLKPGARDEFVRIVSTEALPLVRKAGMDVVAFGLSEAEEDGRVDGYLMRAFATLEEMDDLEDAFYSGDAWRQGPREGMLATIEGYHAVAIEVPEQAVEALRSEL
jgi:hypothetical protein